MAQAEPDSVPVVDDEDDNNDNDDDEVNVSTSLALYIFADSDMQRNQLVVIYLSGRGVSCFFLAILSFTHKAVKQCIQLYKQIECKC